MARKKDRFADIDKSLEPLDENEQELFDFFNAPLVSEDGRHILSTCVWWTSRGRIYPEQFAPVAKMTSAHLVTELNYFWKIFAPRSRVNEDLHRGIEIARLLLDYYQELGKPERWMRDARALVSKLRNAGGEYVWRDSPFTGREILYMRPRPGW
jgi:hypothetical protein